MDPLKNKIVFSLDVYIFLPTSNRIVIILQFIYTGILILCWFSHSSSQASNQQQQPASSSPAVLAERDVQFVCFLLAADEHDVQKSGKNHPPSKHTKTEPRTGINLRCWTSIPHHFQVTAVVWIRRRRLRRLRRLVEYTSIVS